MIRLVLLGAVAACALKVHKPDANDGLGNANKDLALVRLSDSAREHAADGTNDAASVRFGILAAEDATPSCSQCQLPECTFHDAVKSPRLYVAEMSDGGGHRMETILKGMAIAARMNMSFGGTLCGDVDKHIVPVHHTDFAADVNEFFGDKGASTQLFVQQDTCHFKAFCRDNVQTIVKERKGYSDAAEVSCQAVDSGVNPPFNDWFPTAVQARLRRGLDARPLLFEKGRKTMALHVRRGDLPRENIRASPNSYFLKLIQMVRQRISNIDVHVFSDIGTNKNKIFQFWTKSDFDDFIRANVKVHLDEVASVDSWAHFARADVFVMSSSHFSDIGGLLNPKCIIGNGQTNFDYWIDGFELEQPEFQGKLDACLKRI